MLYTTEKQKELISKIVEGYEDYEKLGDKLILRMILDITGNAALEWDVDRSLTLLYNDRSNKTLDFIGCLGLIDYLQKNNLIYIHSAKSFVSNKCVVATNVITRKNASELAQTLGEFKYFYKTSENIEIPVINESKINTDICSSIEYYSNSLVYPMPCLVNYVKKRFKSEEQVRFEEQMNDTQSKHEQTMLKAQETLYWTRWAFFAALIPSLFNIYSFFADMTIRELNSTIKEQTLPEVINANLTNDTIKAFIVNQPKDVKPMVNKQNAKK